MKRLKTEGQPTEPFGSDVADYVIIERQVPTRLGKWRLLPPEVEKYAEEHGRAPVDPLINTDQGDLLLFMFLLGGAIGGFIAGYYWRTLTEGRGRYSLKNKGHKKQAETTDG